MQKILIIRLSSMGDILLTTPLIRAVSKRFPSAKIDFVVKKQFRELLITNPYLNQIHGYDPRSGFKGLRELKKRLLEESYDLIVDLHKNFRSIYLRAFYPGAKIAKVSKDSLARFLLVYCKRNVYRRIRSVPEKYLESLDLTDDRQGLEFPILPTSKTKIETLFDHYGIKDNRPLIGLAPGASRYTKRWPYFAQLGGLLVHELDAQVVLLGGGQDREVCQHVANLIGGNCTNLCGQLSIMETAAAIQKCHVVVSNDTGLVHVASALKKKVVAIYGPTTEEFGFFPYTTEHIALQRPLPCRPCSYHGSDSCKKGHFKCMKDISPYEVLEAVTKLLRKVDIPILYP